VGSDLGGLSTLAHSRTLLPPIPIAIESYERNLSVITSVGVFGIGSLFVIRKAINNDKTETIQR
jgi:hypothetical protein